jgi:hypothetical protein
MLPLDLVREIQGTMNLRRSALALTLSSVRSMAASAAANRLAAASITDIRLGPIADGAEAAQHGLPSRR